MSPVKNGNRSSRGRSAIARTAKFNATGTTNASVPQGYIEISNGSWVRKAWFGGDAKGGAPPSATGFMIPSGSVAATKVSPSAQNANFLFVFRSSNTGTRLTQLPTCDCPGSAWGFEYDEDPWNPRPESI